ncbi:LOW QUALITY PROTEIN: TBC1 domain family member 10B [Enhydra lutris kenyoni]|uniref:LOW QUALITY PROTEIN: TBC1 domain family member 10B n=1 Tax=Enhydra lutris kenyoni TaxID=391180 RepID=A0A2Y9LKP0_ENHLU|nr:LOW QUALITY PROTEIN: TBC1 domain family member 10B [Enhydra lutris kenyoni]
METGPAPLVAPPRRHGAPAAPSPPPRGSRAGPIVVVAPGPPVTTATSAPVTLVPPGEARPAWAPEPPQTSAPAPAPASTVTSSTVVVLTLEASPEAARAQFSPGSEPPVPATVAGTEMSMALGPGADSTKTEEARPSPVPGPGTPTGTPTRTPSRTAPGALIAKPPLAPKPGTTVASGVTARVAAVTAGQVTSGHGAAAATSASTAQAPEDPSGPGPGPSGTCEALVAVVTVTPAPEPAENSQDLGSTSSLGPGISGPRGQAPDTLSYLDSVSLMSGTLESLADDVSSMGSDSEINGLALRKTDKYGFLGGSQYSGSLESSIPVDVARQRELKWLEMFSNWDKWLSRRFQKVKLRCRKGIPSSLRAKAWQYLSNSKELLEQNPGKFEELERAPGDPKWLDVIEKDLHRQFPFHEMFAARGGHGQQDLYRILKAYTIYRPDEGYCQAQAPVAAVLLMHMPAEQAFWCLVQICDKYLPGYYSAGLEAIQLDGEIFFALLRRASPLAHRHLRRQRIDPVLYMTEWFMCIFARTLPWASVLRVWDMFFCEGVKIIFRVALVLLRHTLGSVEKLRSCQGMYETMEQLRNLPQQCMQEDFLVHEVTTLPVTEALIERENTAQLKKWRETRGELQYRPSRRLHGSRAIHEERRRQQPPLGPSSSLLSLPGLKSRGSRAAGGAPSPPPLARRASAGPAPGPVVTAEGLHPSLPSPTGNSTPLGPSKETRKQEKERQKQEKERERERQKQEKERERQEKERQKWEKEQEKEQQKQEKERQKQEKKAQGRKLSLRRKADGPPAPQDGGDRSSASEARQDAYF